MTIAYVYVTILIQKNMSINNYIITRLFNWNIFMHFTLMFRFNLHCQLHGYIKMNCKCKTIMKIIQWVSQIITKTNFTDKDDFKLFEN